MKLINLVVLSTINICFYSCNSETDSLPSSKSSVIEVIENNQGDFQIEIENVIALETSDESLFGEIYKVILTEDGLLIQDLVKTKNIYSFDSQGRYGSKLEIGKGAKEVLHAYSAYYDVPDNELFVYDAGSKSIKIYDQNLKYKRTQLVLGAIAYHNFNKISDQHWLVQTTYRNFPRNDTTARFVLLDAQFRNIEKLYLPFELRFRSVAMIDPFGFNMQKKILFCNVYDNNIYTLGHDASLQIKYRVDFGAYNLSNEERTSTSDEITSLWKNGKRKTGLDYICKSDNFVGFSYLFKEGRQFCIYSRKSGRVFASEFLDDGAVIPGRFIQVRDDMFVIVVESADFMAYKEAFGSKSSLLKELPVKLTDNPILVFYSINEQI